jgi:predicted DNA-binding transcriptional regulator AlpA
MKAIEQHHVIPAPQRSETEPWMPAPKVAEQFGITRRTLTRWLCDERLNFPKPTTLNHRLYFRHCEIETWKLERARLSVRDVA